MWVALLLVPAAMVLAQDTLPPAPEKDPFVGTWKANREHSRPKLSSAEASYLRRMERDGEDLVFSSSMAGNRKTKPRQYRIRCDGAPHPIPTGPLVSCKYVRTDRVEGETVEPIGRKFYWAREVSQDGGQMIETSYKDSGRTRVHSVWVLDRVR